MSENINFQQFQDAANVLKQYQGVDVNTLSPEEKATLATSNEIVKRVAQDAQSVYTDINSIIQSNELSLATPLMLKNLESGQPSLFSPIAANLASTDGNVWFSGQSMVNYLFNMIDLTNQLKEVDRLMGQSEVTLMIVSKDIGYELGELKKELREKEAQLAILQAVSAGVGIAIGVAGGLVGGLKGGNATAVGKGLHTGSQFGGQFSQIGSHLAESFMKTDIGDIERTTARVEVAKEMVQKALSTATDERKSALEQISQALSNMENTIKEIKRNSGSFSPH